LTSGTFLITKTQRIAIVTDIRTIGISSTTLDCS
jgi:hypothetical protein